MFDFLVEKSFSLALHSFSGSTRFKAREMDCLTRARKPKPSFQGGSRGYRDDCVP